MRRLAALLLLLVASSVRANEVRLSFTGCDELDAAEVRRVVLLESRREAARLSTAITCEATRVVLDRVGVRRQLDLATTAPIARARLVALAIIELGDTTPDATPARPPPPVAIAAPPSPPKSSPPPPSIASPLAPAPPIPLAALPATRTRAMPSRIRVLANGAGLDFFGGSGVLGGGGLRVGGDHPYHLAWWLDVDSLHGRVGTTVGSIGSDVVEVSALFGAHRTWSRVALRAGVGVAGGAVRMDGHSTSAAIGTSFWAGWVGSHGGASLSVTPISRLVLEASLDSGWVAVPVRALADSRTAASVSGAWIGFQLGAGIFF